MKNKDDLTISEAAQYCKEKITDFPIKVDSINRKFYREMAARNLDFDMYNPEYGNAIRVVKKDDIDKLMNTVEFEAYIEKQRKDYNSRYGSSNNSTNTNKCNQAIGRVLVKRGSNPIVGDIYTGSENSGFDKDSVLVVTNVGKTSVLFEQITPDRAEEVNSAFVRRPVSFARSLNEVIDYNYYGNANNIAIFAEKLSADPNHTF